MSDLARGNQLFANRVEYPLPQQSGVRDYVFNFVSATAGSDGSKAYGVESRAFFNAFFPNHVKHDVHTLEDLINVLKQDVSGANPIHLIREIIV